MRGTRPRATRPPSDRTPTLKSISSKWTIPSRDPLVYVRLIFVLVLLGLAVRFRLENTEEKNNEEKERI